MSLLQPATLQQNSLKLAAQGEGGSGKTLTATMIAIGLSKHYHQNAPIAFVDTEHQSDFMLEVCQKEGVPLLVTKSKSFIDMRDSLTLAESEGCCALLVDSYTHPYVELQESFKQQANIIGKRTQFHHRDQPQLVWEAWTQQWKASPLHCLFAGRLGFKWGDVIDEQGDVQHVRLGTRMRGDSDSGYEPNLVIEMESIDNLDKRHIKTRSRKGTNTHWMRVIKDRFMVLNGLQFAFEDLNGYKAGDFNKVFAAIQPHIEKLAIGPIAPREAPRSSAELFSTPSGESKFAERQRRVTIAIEEFRGALRAMWPGETGPEKRFRQIVIETVFSTRSETKLETLAPEMLESGVATLAIFEGLPLSARSSEAQIIAGIQEAKDARIAYEREMVL